MNHDDPLNLAREEKQPFLQHGIKERGCYPTIQNYITRSVYMGQHNVLIPFPKTSESQALNDCGRGSLYRKIVLVGKCRGEYILCLIFLSVV